MQSLMRAIDAAEVPPGSFAVWWLGQAGFAFKSGRGARIFIDPYLSNGVERAFGFKRLSLAPIAAEEVRAEWIVNSHEHLDHLDLDALPAIAARNPGCRFAGSRSCVPGYEACGIPSSNRVTLEPGKSASLDGVVVHAIEADHGTLSADALSLLLDFGETSAFFSGDTALRFDRVRPLADRRPDVALPCINGAFGNMDARDAARLVGALAPRVAVPCHFWMFKEHGGDPEAFVHSCAELCPGVEVRFLTPGEGLLVTPEAIAGIAD
jgi:L-ascorbate 6-phosphate lactonase